MKELLLELYQITFISAILYIVYTLFSFVMKAYGYFILKGENITYTLTNREKILLWVSISIFISYLIN